MNTSSSTLRGQAGIPPAVLTVEKLRKAFGAVQALDGVDLSVTPGEVHALIGENGAGKSTLMKVISGVYRPDDGAVRFNGRPYQVRSPLQARRRGVVMIYQELTLAPHLTVEENITLGIESSFLGVIRHKRAKIREALSKLGHSDLDLRERVSDLGIGTQQVVEIARALVTEARLVILDEPTSSLSKHDAKALFNVVRRLKSEGIAVIYISHFLEEVKEIADSYTVLRDGATVASGRIADVTQMELIEKMVGRSLDEMFPKIPHSIGKPVLTVTGLSGQPVPKNAGFVLHEGEILGLAGLVGAGRSETLRCLFGLQSARQGTARLNENDVRVSTMTPPAALARGLNLLSENRKEEGLATALPIRTNLTLSNLKKVSCCGVVLSARERKTAEEWCRRLNVRYDRVDQSVDTLSGGNQQKIAVGRLLYHDSEILFFDEPTRGVDVGSKAEICRLIGELAAAGKAIVVASSYLPELFGICDTLAVMYRGEISEVRPVAQWSEAEVMAFATLG